MELVGMLVQMESELWLAPTTAVSHPKVGMPWTLELAEVYDQSPPFPYCNCAKALAERAQQGSETSQKTGPTTQRVYSVTATDEQVDGRGSGTEGWPGSAFKEDDRTEPTSCSCTEPL